VMAIAEAKKQELIPVEAKWDGKIHTF